ncbi:hypothetical protein WJX82_005280 [Trebouxia sp. C0006]
MHARRTNSSVQEPGDTQSLASGTPWSRQGGAICSIALLLLGGSLLIYGGALVAVGHKPLDEGQAEQWRRIARIRFHQIQEEKAASTVNALEQAHAQSDPQAEAAPEEPLSKHAAAKIRQAFEHIISSEELPRQPRIIGSLTDHLNSSGQPAKSIKQKSALTDSLHQIRTVDATTLKSARTQHRKLTLAGS